MEFGVSFENDKALAAVDEYKDSNKGWDDEEETLSFCGFVKEQAAHNGDSKLRDSNAGSSGLKEDFDFDFDFGRTSSTTHNICSAEDLFQQGRVLPFTVQRCLSESEAHFSDTKSNSRQESRRLLNEKMQAWRTDSSDIKSNSLTKDQASQRKGFHSASAKNLQHGNFVTLSTNSTSKANRRSKPPPRISKTCMKWQQFLTLGLMKTDPVTVEDIFISPGSSNNTGLDNSVFKRSVSCDYQESLIAEEKEDTAVKIQQKSKSGKGKLWEKGTVTSRTMMATLKSLNRCKISTDSVKNCLIEDRKTGTRGPPIKSDEYTENLAQPSIDKGQGYGHSDSPVFRSNPKKSRRIFARLLFQRGI
ncbi:uncharacterized protein LOC131037796 [Cryptomeria japonica]|uniref:uncharacterized protein LOC131037796 n=1 Tax=Cryptomeria japonica TaxID=3369 RepID=UPI0025ACCE39|nr:uncharacterized protein LOC131037796 [Cryptomeria japonica]XP_057825981.1 uncharacterized protein LOC131037796 [Cryptomeria japonica]